MQDGTAPINALDRLADLVSDDMAAVNRLIVERMHSPVPMIPQLAGHIVAAGGKRLRPLLTLAAARMCGYGGDHHVGLAACVEFIHTATLLHDDVVDESALRRGRDSANAIFGNQASVLVGDFLFSRSFQLMVDAGSLEVLAILANAAATIAEGEVLQLTTANDPATTEEAYYAVIRGKTAALFAAAARVGAVVAGRPKTDADALDAYGMNLGLAFQIVDDVLDYDADQAALGKTVGDDFREGKATLPILLAYERGSADERAFWHRCIADEDQRDGDLETAIGLLRSSGALTDSASAARKCAADAKAALQGFNGDAAYGKALADVADFCVERAF
ncbi:MAG: polyprenyl synthetase family protein [Alphaproteobacteria bacterium]